MAIVILLSLKFQIAFFKDLLPLNYKYSYYMDVLIDPKKNKELRLYSTYDYVLNNFESYGKDVCDKLVNILFKASILTALLSIVRYVEMGLIYAFVGIKTLANNLPISKFSLTASAAISFSTCITSIIDATSGYIRSIEYVKPLLELMSINEEETSGNKVLEEIKTIEFKNVTFSYPKTENVVLNNISFKINSNEKISIVGVNGAGKTTIIKLLCRLYEGYSGEILINDISIKEYERHSYISKISAIFQDYKLYAYSIKDNILPGISDEKAKEICKEIDILNKIEQLEYGLDSVMLKSYDDKGIELSGGQQQKIAIARALAKDSDLLIMDEPTSALDPLAEEQIYKNFNTLAKDKMAIYISHRMSSSVFCDKILVLDNGVVTDYDTHTNLIKNKDSLYTKLFNTQAKNYKYE